MSGNLDRARALVAGALEIEVAAVGADAAIGTLEAWDSLAHLRLIEAIERAIGAELPGEAIASIGSLADVAAILAAAETAAG